MAAFRHLEYGKGEEEVLQGRVRPLTLSQGNVVGDWPWHTTGDELESHGAQGRIIQCALRFPEEPGVKGTVVRAIRRV